MTLQLTRDAGYARGFLSARSVTGFLSDVYPSAADELGKIFLVADERVCISNNMLLILYSYIFPPVLLVNKSLTLVRSGSRSSL